jgi:hypothetical protein
MEMLERLLKQCQETHEAVTNLVPQLIKATTEVDGRRQSSCQRSHPTPSSFQPRSSSFLLALSSSSYRWQCRLYFSSSRAVLFGTSSRFWNAPNNNCPTSPRPGSHPYAPSLGSFTAPYKCQTHWLNYPPRLEPPTNISCRPCWTSLRFPTVTYAHSTGSGCFSALLLWQKSPQQMGNT